jgi:hypothetical protein
VCVHVYVHVCMCMCMCMCLFPCDDLLPKHSPPNPPQKDETEVMSVPALTVSAPEDRNKPPQRTSHESEGVGQSVVADTQSNANPPPEAHVPKHRSAPISVHQVLGTGRHTRQQPQARGV